MTAAQEKRTKEIRHLYGDYSTCALLLHCFRNGIELIEGLDPAEEEDTQRVVKTINQDLQVLAELTKREE